MYWIDILTFLTAAFFGSPEEQLALAIVWAITSLACFRGVVFGNMSNPTLEIARSLIITVALTMLSVRVIQWVYARLFPASPEEVRLEEISLYLEAARRHRTEAIDGADVTDIDTVIEALEAQAVRVKERLGSRKKKKQN